MDEVRTFQEKAAQFLYNQKFIQFRKIYFLIIYNSVSHTIFGVKLNWVRNGSLHLQNCHHRKEKDGYNVRHCACFLSSGKKY